MACAVYKSRIDLSDKEKQLLRQAKKKGRKDARLVLRILIIMLANVPALICGAKRRQLQRLVGRAASPARRTRWLK